MNTSNLLFLCVQVTEAMKVMIIHELSGNHLATPAQIMLVLRRRIAAFGDVSLPTLRQVQYNVSKIRKEQYGNVNDKRVAMVVAASMANSESTSPAAGYAFGLNTLKTTGDVGFGDGSNRFPLRIGT